MYRVRDAQDDPGDLRPGQDSYNVVDVRVIGQGPRPCLSDASTQRPQETAALTRPRTPKQRSGRNLTAFESSASPHM